MRKFVLTIVLLLATLQNSYAECLFVSELSRDYEGKIRYSYIVQRSEVVFDAGVDQVSVGCMSCHDGTIGPDAPVHIGHRASRGIDTVRGPHPIAVPIPTDRGYHPNDLPLFGGNVGCLTCHDTSSELKYHLRVSNEHSRLCLTCHNK